MNRLFAVALLALVAASPACAQSTATPVVPGYLSTTGCPSGYTVCFVPYGSGTPVTPLSATAVAGTQRGVSIATATALTIPATATLAVLSVQGTNNTSGICAYWQDDGTNPTASAGQPIAALAVIVYKVTSLPIKFIQATGATCTLNASYYK